MISRRDTVFQVALKATCSSLYTKQEAQPSIYMDTDDGWASQRFFDRRLAFVTAVRQLQWLVWFI